MFSVGLIDKALAITQPEGFLYMYRNSRGMCRLEGCGVAAEKEGMHISIACTVLHLFVEGDMVVYWLARWTPDRAVWVRSLARVTSCVLGQDTSVSQCLSLHPVV